LLERANGESLSRGGLEAGDALKPRQDANSSSRAWRPYTLLRLRYVEARDPVEVERELAMSKSQYYREHEQALARLTAVIAGQLSRAAEALRPVPELDPKRPRTTNLPLQLTSFVGRAEELAQIRRLLATTRLLTLTIEARRA
jgi:hypothetical protein